MIEILKDRIQQYTNYANYLKLKGRENELMYTTEQVIDILEDILNEVEKND